VACSETRSLRRISLTLRAPIRALRSSAADGVLDQHHNARVLDGVILGPG
jgi:hypothetical protein